MRIDLDEALAALPHGPEFRFLDRLIELEPGKSGVGEYRLRGNEVFLAGHFPGEPLLPGVLLVEAGAQLAGVVAQTDPHIPPLKSLKLTSIRGAKIMGTAGPGQAIRVEAEVVGRLGGLVQAHVRVRLLDRLILQAELVLSGVEDSVTSAKSPTSGPA